MSDLITALERQEQELLFESFDHTDAWLLGSRITAIAQQAGHRVGIDIRRPGLILFRSALPGITPDQETWIIRKAAVVLRMEASSALVDARLSAAGVDPARHRLARRGVRGDRRLVPYPGPGGRRRRGRHRLRSVLTGGSRPHCRRHPRLPGRRGRQVSEQVGVRVGRFL